MMAKTYPYKERRHHKRIKAVLPAIILPDVNKDPFKDIIFSDIEDISIGGGRIPVNKQFTNISSTIQISFFIPSDDEKDDLKLVNAKATIERLERTRGKKKAGDYTAGFKFTAINKKNHARLSKFIKKNIH